MSNGIEIAVVTGGGSGIGRALCRRLAADGTKVVVVDINDDAARAVADEIGGIARGVNVADEAAVAALVDSIEQELGPIDMFVSNAGVLFGDGESGSISKEGGVRAIEDRWAPSWEVNVMAQVYAARAVIPRMLERGGGYIVNVASAAGLLSQIFDAAYATTKHASVGFTEALAIEYGDRGIKVSCVCPQAVATGLLGGDVDMESFDDVSFGGAEIDGVLPPETVADVVVSQAVEGRFLILPHETVTGYIQRKTSDYDRWIGGMRKFRRSLEK